MILKCLFIFVNVIFSGCVSSSISRHLENNDKCVLPPHPKNGKYVKTPVSASDPHARDQAKLICEPGFIVEGKEHFQCVEGVWKEFSQCSPVPGCKLNKQTKYSYECQYKNGDYFACGENVNVGTEVLITSQDKGKASHWPVSVRIRCTSVDTFNVSLGCMGDIVKLENEIHNLSMRNLTNYENNISYGNQTSLKFKELVENFNIFKSQVITKVIQMNRKIDECNIYTDILSSHLTQGNQTLFLSNRKENDKSCKLPVKPKNGQYKVVTALNDEASATNEEKSTQDDQLVLYYECDPGFVLFGTRAPRCVDSVWLDKFPECSVSCKLDKKSKLKYQCPNAGTNNALCGEHVPVGSEVRVSHENTNDASLIFVSIECLPDGTFNTSISTNCVEDMEKIQSNIERATVTKLLEFETKFYSMSSGSFEFEDLVKEFYSFQHHVTASLHNVQQKAEECDIYLDLLLLK